MEPVSHSNLHVLCSTYWRSAPESSGSGTTEREKYPTAMIVGENPAVVFALVILTVSFDSDISG